MPVEVAANGLVQARAQAQVMLHAFAPKIQVAIAQAHFLAILVGHQQGQWRAGVEQFDRIGQKLDLAGAHVRVPLAFRAQANRSL
jgi:hypothetical protein